VARDESALPGSPLTQDVPPTGMTNEARLKDAAAKGEILDFGHSPADVRDMSQWGAERVIRAEWIYALCVSSGSDDVSAKGVRIRGARIVGSLNLESATLRYPLVIRDSLLEQVAVLTDARLRLLNLKNSRIPGLDGDRLVVDGPLFFQDGFMATGEIRLRGARIQGQLGCRGGTFEAADGYALNADGAVVSGGVFLTDGFTAKGEVCFTNSELGGLYCGGGKFEYPSGRALNAASAVVKANVFLNDGFTANGEVCFVGAQIGGQFSCRRGTFEHPEGQALAAELVAVKGNVSLNNGFVAVGEVRLLNSNLGGLDCRRGTFRYPKGRALNADGATVSGSMFLSDGFAAEGEVCLVGSLISGVLDFGGAALEHTSGRAIGGDRMVVRGTIFLNNGFTAAGEVCLLGAQVGGQVVCNTGHFLNPGGYALNADGLVVRGGVFLVNGFRAEGEIRLRNSEVGEFDCRGGSIVNPDGAAIYAAGCSVKGNILLAEGFSAQGTVTLSQASVGGGIYCYRGTFSCPGRVAFQCDGAVVSGMLQWVSVSSSGLVDFAHARVDRLLDDEGSWPAKDALRLTGLSYGAFHHAAPTEAQARIRWLRRQAGFSPQPYEQLARVYRDSGRDEDARRIAIAKQDDRRRRGNLGRWTRLLSWYLDVTIRYGYRPERALVPLLALILAGYVIFSYSWSSGAMIPTKSEARLTSPARQVCTADYPCFEPAVYSVELIVPLVNLHQVEFWAPDATRTWGVAARAYGWVATLLGWLFTTTLVAGLSGLVPRTIDRSGSG